MLVGSVLKETHIIFISGVLPFLLQVSYLLSEHVSGIILQLIGLALVGPTKESSSAQEDGKQEKLPKKGLHEVFFNAMEKILNSTAHGVKIIIVFKLTHCHVIIYGFSYFDIAG